MRVCTIVLAVTILVPIAVSGSAAWGRGRCSVNSACPTGSECVDNFCSVCAVDPARCLRSVDRCKSLNCPSDSDCYVSEQANSDATVTLKLGCFKTNPCAGVTCQNGYCENVAIGGQPPFAQCRPNSPVDPCNAAKCPDTARCMTRVGLCGFFPCLLEGICVDQNDCASCNYFYQYCEITVQNNAVKGTCTNLFHPFMQRPHLFG